MEKISEILRRELQNHPDSLRTIGLRVGIDPSQLSRFVREERTLRQDAIDALCAELGLTLKSVATKRGRGV